MVGEEVGVAADGVVGGWGVDGLLDVAAVEVVIGALQVGSVRWFVCSVGKINTG